MSRGVDRVFDYKLVIVVRKDLQLSPGKLAVQVAHAATSCAIQAKKDKPDYFSRWYNEGQRKIVVKVEGVDELRELFEEARAEGLISILITDAGMTEIPPNTTTCLGIGPAPNNLLDKVTGKLPLL